MQEQAKIVEHIEDVAAIFRRSVRTVYRWIDQGMPQMDDLGFDIEAISRWREQTKQKYRKKSVRNKHRTGPAVMKSKDGVNIETVARHFDVSVRTVYRWIGRGMPCRFNGEFDLELIETWRKTKSERLANFKDTNRERKHFVYSVSEVAHFFSVSAQTVSSWIHQHGMPRVGEYAFDLRAIFVWLRRRMVEEKAASSGPRKVKRDSARVQGLADSYIVGLLIKKLKISRSEITLGMIERQREELLAKRSVGMDQSKLEAEKIRCEGSGRAISRKRCLSVSGNVNDALFDFCNDRCWENSETREKLLPNLTAKDISDE